jgi:hypothetical protein
MYDLLVAVSPEIYRAVRYPSKGVQSGSVESRAVWYLEAVAFDSDTQRLQELAKLLQQEPIEKDKADFALKVIQEHHCSSACNSNPTSPSIRSRAGARTSTLKGPSTLDALLGARTTVEERVRARATIVKRQDDASKLSTANGNDNGKAAMLVRLADVLWVYANTLRTRRLHKTQAAPLKSCRVPLQDLVTVLQASLIQRGTKSSRSQQASMHACKGEKIAKRQIVEALVTLESRFPNWIVLTANGNPPAKDSMVRINAIGYTEIRQELLRPQPSSDDHASPQISSTRKHGVNSILQPLQPSDAKRRKKAFSETTIDR